MAIDIGRRGFITLIGGAAAWPVSARAQRSAIPAVGFLAPASPQGFAAQVVTFRQGLKEAGYTEGQNVTIEYRWAEGRYDQMPALVNDLVRRRVAAIVVIGPTTAQAAKAATMTIPIVFLTSSDPVEQGLVASMNQPGGNLTGVTTLNVDVESKRLELMHELVPVATSMVMLINPTNPNASAYMRETQAAARTLGLQLHVLQASAEGDFEMVFEDLARLRAGGLVIAVDTFFISRSEQLAALALRHAVPTIYLYREFAAAGGLMSYGGSLTESYHLAGVYAGRVLKGEKPADLPVQQATKIELIINLEDRQGALGITVPISPFSAAPTKVIE